MLKDVFTNTARSCFTKVLSLHGNNRDLPRVINHFLKVAAGRIVQNFAIILVVLMNTIFITKPTKLLTGLAPSDLSAAF